MTEVQTLTGVVGLISLYVAYSWGWKRALVSMYRQDLFTIRDQMFIDAASGKLDFNDPGYGMLRIVMQQAISHCDQISWFQLAFLRVFVWKSVRPKQTTLGKLEHYLEQMKDRPQAQLLRSHLDEFERLSVLHTARMYWPVLGAIGLWLLLRLPLDYSRAFFTSRYARKRATAYVEAVCHMDPTPC